MQLRKFIIPGLIVTCLSAPVMAQNMSETERTGATLMHVSMVDSDHNSVIDRVKQQQQQQQQQQQKRAMTLAKSTMPYPADDQGFLV